MSPLVVITGPTASGKTTLAMEVAKLLNGEIICADSRTIYKGMDIGTAKPSKKAQKLIPHHIIDVVEPNQPFTVVTFKKMAVKAIDDIARRGKLPIMVGGTGLYIDSVIFDYKFGPASDSKIRAELNLKTVEELQDLCKENDVPLPENSKNKRHLIRAIELGGLIQGPKKLRPNTIIVAITTSNEDLKQRIIYRAETMIDEGVVEEVRRLGKKYGWDSEAMKGNIYRNFRPVVEGTMDISEALELVIKSDMQLAKRQITWLKRNPYVIWGNPSQLLLTIEHFVQQNKLLESIPS
jgi:tRNA dimethylallyltransferase